VTLCTSLFIPIASSCINARALNICPSTRLNGRVAMRRHAYDVVLLYISNVLNRPIAVTICGRIIMLTHTSTETTTVLGLHDRVILEYL